MATACVALSVRDESAVSPLRRPSSAHSLDESILIYLTSGGSTVALNVLESDSIASVKLRIQNCKGFVTRTQKLVHEGRELARSDSLVRDYGVTDGNVLHLVLRLSDLQYIVVKTTCGKVYEFHVDRSENVGYVKEQIAKEAKGFFDVKDQVLICDGEELDDQWPIDDICGSNDAVLHLVVQRSAKVRVQSIDNGKMFEFSIDAQKSNARRYDEEEVVVEGEKRWKKDYGENQVVARKQPDRDIWLKPLIINPKIEISSVIEDMINSSFAGMEMGNKPIRSSEGSGGVYFMQDPSGEKIVSVFKPIDEEPMAVNNPQGLPLSVNGEGLKRGTRVGEGALREVAAYLLDHPKSGRRSFSGGDIGFSGVPPTTMVECLHQGFNHSDGYGCHPENMKIGSLQMFMKNNGSCEDIGPRAFPVNEVHKISVIDMRLANADRHAGNILLGKGEDNQIVLIPIDHGYCLPENFEDCTFEWLYWPQARQPFSDDTLEYIDSLDVEQDIALLKFHGWELSAECARVFRISTMLLKKGAKRGLSPFTIGSIMCRETLKKESVIEEIVEEAQDAVLPGTSEDAFLTAVSEIMDRRLDGISTI
ncbi:Phosphatidylinositol 4-kinase gamma 4 [Ranunculus cassubicifolius]